MASYCCFFGWITRSSRDKSCGQGGRLAVHAVHGIYHYFYFILIVRSIVWAGWAACRPRCPCYRRGRPLLNFVRQTTSVILTCILMLLASVASGAVPCRLPRISGKKKWGFVIRQSNFCG